MSSGVRVQAGGGGMGTGAKAEVVKFIEARNGPNPRPGAFKQSKGPQSKGPTRAGFRYIKIKAPAEAPAAKPQYTTPKGKRKAPAVEGDDGDEDDDDDDEAMGL